MNERQLLDILVRFATTLTADFSIQDVLDHLVEQIVDLLPVTGAGVLLMDGDTNHHFVSATDQKLRRIEGMQVRLGEGPCLVAFHTDRAVAIPDLHVDRTLPRFSAAAAAVGLGAVFSFPLRHDGDRIGALELYATDPVELNTAELDGGQTLADVIASYLLIARRRENDALHAAVMTEEALHDPLTELPNRRLLADRLEQATERSKRSGRPFGILFCDLDAFKLVNDRYGHPVGDRLLVALAERLSHTLRPQDTLARVAGDEFMIICEDLPDQDQAAKVAERCLAALREPFRLDGTVEPIRLAMSVGVTLAGPGHDLTERAVVRADKAMYRAKRLGGDRHETMAHTAPPVTEDDVGGDPAAARLA